MEFFQKLMLAKQVSFEEGTITLLNQRMVIIPLPFFTLYTAKINSRPELTKKIYGAAKKAGRDKFVSGIKKTQEANFRDYANLLKEVATFGGWGITEFSYEDLDNKSVTVTVENPTISSLLSKKVNNPCDHIIRGFFAGGCSIAFGKEMDAIETECVALGNKNCKFIIDSSVNLKKGFPELFDKQVGDVIEKEVK